MELVAQRKRRMCWCTSMHEPRVLARSGQYFMKQLRQIWKICIRTDFFNSTMHSFDLAPRLGHRRPNGY
ncbi:hypothetical protein TNCV_1522861 [Trichonephila clavipes]|nr:hypothetical protein TNCV_1522861 [Trichonephila clavipes]